MEWIQNFWAEYGPLITGVLGSGLGAAVVAFISSLVAKVVANKITGTLDVDKIVGEVTERVTQNVTKNLTGSVLDVDISEVVEQKLDEVLGEITVQVKDVKSAVNSMKECSALTAKAVGKSKLLDKAEQAALVAEAEKLAAVSGFKRSYTDFRKMLDTERPDGVFLLTPVSATAAVGEAVLAAGYPVMIEKPPGRNRAELLHLIRTSRRNNVPAIVAFNRRYSPLLLRGVEILQQEVPGEKIEHIRCDFFRSERFDPDFSTTAVHGIDAVRHLSGSRYREVAFHYQELERDGKKICRAKTIRVPESIPKRSIRQYIMPDLSFRAPGGARF